MRQATGWRFIRAVIDVYHLPRHDFRISRALGIKMKRQGSKTDRIVFLLIDGFENISRYILNAIY